MLSRSARRFFGKWGEFQPSPKSMEFIDMEFKYGCNNFDPTPAVIAKGRGAEVWDVDGKRYIDCLGGYSSVNQGHCHPKIVKAATEQMERVTMTARAMFNDRLGPWEKYLSQLIGYDKVLFMNGGVEATESAVKFTRRWAYDVKGVPDGQATVLFCKHNFWGRSIAACGSSDDPKRFARFGPFAGLNFELIDFGCDKALEEALKSNPNIAGFVFEPIQGEAGVVVPPQGYYKKVRDLCTKYNVLMVTDEVQTGLGRTGKLMGIDWEPGVKPDIVCMAKSLSGGFYPIAATLADEKVMSCIQPGDHGSTFGGNPLSAAIGMAATKVIVEENLPANALAQGDFIKASLKSMAGKYPYLKDVRGVGLMLAMVFDDKHSKTARDFTIAMCKNGVLSCATKRDKMRITPPLVIDRKLAEEVVERVEQVLKTF